MRNRRWWLAVVGCVSALGAALAMASSDPPAKTTPLTCRQGETRTIHFREGGSVTIRPRLEQGKAAADVSFIDPPPGLRWCNCGRDKDTSSILTTCKADEECCDTRWVPQPRCPWPTPIPTPHGQ